MTPNPELADASGPADFVHRHIGPSPADVTKMLETIGVSSTDELIEQTIPNAIRQRVPLDLGPPLSETEVLQKLREMAAMLETRDAGHGRSTLSLCHAKAARGATPRCAGNDALFHG